MKKTFDIKKMAKDLGISELEIKLALKIPLVKCEAKTIAEAKEIYKKAADGSEEKAAAGQRWAQLSMIDITMAENLEQIKDIYGRILEGSAAEVPALIKWIEFANTAAELEKVYKATPSGSELEVAARKKWELVSLKEVQAANNVHDIGIAYNSTPRNSEAEIAALIKLLMLSDVSRVQEIYNCARGRNSQSAVLLRIANNFYGYCE